MISKKKDNTN